MNNTCVSCGEIIPEGQHVCKKCLANARDSGGGKSNYKRLLESNEYDTLVRMNANILKAHLCCEGRPCIMTAVGETKRNARCMKYHPECTKCIADWLNEKE